MSASSVEDKLRELGFQLPPSPQPVGAYVPVIISGQMAYLSGQISKDASGKVWSGKVGQSISAEEGKRAAEIAALNALSVLKAHVGLDRVERCIRLVGYIQAAPDFYAIPDVLNGASNLFLSVFGDKGKHARSAVGMASLPMNAAVEIELTVELKL